MTKTKTPSRRCGNGHFCRTAFRSSDVRCCSGCSSSPPRCAFFVLPVPRLRPLCPLCRTQRTGYRCAVLAETAIFFFPCRPISPELSCKEPTLCIGLTERATHLAMPSSGPPKRRRVIPQHAHSPRIVHVGARTSDDSKSRGPNPFTLAQRQVQEMDFTFHGGDRLSSGLCDSTSHSSPYGQWL